MADTDKYSAIDRYVDWPAAEKVATKLLNPGPAVSAQDAEQAVTQLYELATSSLTYVQDVTELPNAGDAEVRVVDRKTWVRHNLISARHTLAPAAKKHTANTNPSVKHSLLGQMSGAELGSVLAFLASRVLGQFDPFVSSGPGQLLLVAPNIVKVERQLDVDPSDFRLWVCAHEQTHRLQFAAAPWLADHLITLVSEVLTGVVEPTDETPNIATGMLSRVPKLWSGADRGLTALAPQPHVRETIDQITAIMSLLEGHADYVMDDVGPEIIPTVAEIRTAFSAYRRSGGLPGRLLRRLIGLEAKLKQYQDGAVFVRTALRHTSMAEFNRVWEHPQNLPTLHEIHNPVAWLARLGAAAAPPASKV